MKNQYVGDINDYHKYGLLRILTDFGRLRLAVCWMLTDPDTRNDGARIGYLQKDGGFPRHDEELFRALHDVVHKIKVRSVDSIASSGIFMGAKYFSDILTDEVSSRDRWLAKLEREARHFDMIFFDPDNGLEVKSVQRGRRNSCKFLYYEELAALTHLPASFIVYQHFPREKREPYVRRRAEELRSATGRRVSSFRTGSVVFFLLQPQEGECHFHRVRPALSEKWGGRFKSNHHG
ncbi:hypothetical protein IT570_09365 [Candidatus Sumerlaeota bacterium]|nr:hypothetical protein [Candidatus Sumerlaeota bacterium]